MRRPPPPTTRLVLGVLLLAAGLASCTTDDERATSPSSTSTTADDRYEPELADADCAALGVPDGLLRCATLVVPEDRDDPQGRQVELPVLRSSDAAGDDDHDGEAVVVLHGGPGAGVVDSWASWTTVLDDLGLQLVLYDQRGGGRAVPRLDCPGHAEALALALERAGSWQDEHDDVAAALSECHETLQGAGVGLDEYDTPTSTRDLEDLRRALGVERMTLVGSSYGTRLALDYLRTHPDRVRGLVLDGADPPGALDAGDTTELPERAVQRLLAACESDEACAASYPDLEDTLESAITSFDEAPRQVEVFVPDGSTRTLTLTGADLYAGLYVAMYDSEVVPLLPSLIAAIETDDGTILDTFAARVVPALASTAVGAFVSIDCADTRGGSAGGTSVDGATSADPGRAATLALAGSLPYCEVWPVPPVVDGFSEPVRVDDPPPTLVVSGELDPVTPVEDGRAVADALDAHHVVVPRGGHAPMMSDRCAQEVLRSFLLAPEQPDLGCVDSLQPDPFT